MRVLSRKKGFTLTEILVSILIIGIVMSAVMTLLVSVFKSYEFHQDISEAKQRGQIAIAAMEPLIVNAGLGMPAASDDFMEAFKDNSIIIDKYDNKANKQNFTGPVQIATVNQTSKVSEAVLILDKENDLNHTDEKFTGDSLWVVYALPSGFGVSNEVGAITSTASLEIDPDDDYSPLKSNLEKYNDASPSLKSWVTFPAGKYPLKVNIDPPSLNSTTPLILETTKNQVIHRFDELHYVRAAKIWNNGGNLLMNELMGSGEQPVVDGIYGMRCVYDRGGDRILTVTVLARADTLRPELNITSVDGWGDIGTLNKKYRYAAVSRSWRMRN